MGNFFGFFDEPVKEVKEEPVLNRMKQVIEKYDELNKDLDFQKKEIKDQIKSVDDTQTTKLNEMEKEILRKHIKQVNGQELGTNLYSYRF